MTDNWPRTSRPMPWLIAGFLAMLFLIPFDGITFKVHLPADIKLDRVLVGLMIAVWVAQRLTGNTFGGPRRKRTTLERAVLIYTAIALLSIVLNIDRIVALNQLGFSEKSLSQFLGYVVFFFMVVATVRTEELGAYAKLILTLTCLTAAGTIYEAHTGINLFYEWSGKIFSPIATVMPAPTSLVNPSGRPLIVGPTAHGLAVTSMLTIALPFAVLPLLTTKRTYKRIGYIVIIGLILAAEVSTARKTAFVAPVAAFIVLMAYNRRLRRWAPFMVLALIPVIHFAAPGALGQLTGVLGGAANSASTNGRVSDYAAVTPDILNHPLIGRGYGTLDPDNYLWYRILDNEYLDEIFQVGFLGLIAYVAIIVSALTTAHRVIKRGGQRAPLALAAAGGCAAFGVVSATFDSAGFPQAPYTFFFAAAVITITAVNLRREDQRMQGNATSRISSAEGAEFEIVGAHASTRSTAHCGTDAALGDDLTRNRSEPRPPRTLTVTVPRRTLKSNARLANNGTAPVGSETSSDSPDTP